jgi:hypothetical protein
MALSDIQSFLSRIAAGILPVIEVRCLPKQSPVGSCQPPVVPVYDAA